MERFAKRFDRRVKAIERDGDIRHKSFLNSLKLKKGNKKYSLHNGNYHPHKHTVLDTISESKKEGISAAEYFRDNLVATEILNHPLYEYDTRNYKKL